MDFEDYGYIDNEIDEIDEDDDFVDLVLNVAFPRRAKVFRE